MPGNVSPVLARCIRLAIGIVGLWLVFAPGNLIARAQTAESAQAPPAIIYPSKMRLTFDEPFKRLSISAWGPGTRWIAHTPFAQDFGSARFDDPDYGGPFALTPQGLEITAKQDAKGHWHSGLICSVDHGAETGFAQKYGYFEMKAKLPNAPGVWPGFWLVGTDRSQGSAEFDILESYGSRFPGYLTTLHFWAKPPRRYGANHFVKVPPGMLASQFNTFGALLTPQVVAMYFNRHLVWSVPMLPQFNTPMYILADLALGGGWPIKQLSSPQVMDIQYIRVYQIK